MSLSVNGFRRQLALAAEPDAAAVGTPTGHHDRSTAPPLPMPARDSVAEAVLSAQLRAS
ncbi:MULTISPECIES: hypothetical protein [unclassified Rhodococcus (in: high G+C Gram-positive bacteria)]|uniref:hypothetical protein n=1 Tax=unclassified Rhodococcus (in: high G+C Gram-positive bacteria) TaxID=192944 RepID=UPI001639F732|nr:MULTISPECIES: hypothetical protein [unclassified Rhodococcus (in: high G+C Gram-positive bacteria)]MBC2643289.1 hypothetical protein [Rhodococcus sp. 3A]MBC2891970.1 hypothetical protein [Rhodococcus sp. 4CII]